MARQKITAESRLRTENTELKRGLRKAHEACDDLRESWSTTLQELSKVKMELASRDASIAELQYQLRQTRTQLGLISEQCEDYRVAAAVNARLMTTFGELNEKLRYPPAERSDAKARPE